MNAAFLAKQKLELKVVSADYYVKEVNIDAVNNSLERILAHMKTNVYITEDEIDDNSDDSSEDVPEKRTEEHYKIDNVQMGDGGYLFSEEEIEKISEQVKQAAQEAAQKAEEEGKTKEEVNQIKRDTAQQKADELTLSGVKQQFRDQMMTNVVADNSLVLFTRGKDAASDKLEEVADLMDEIFEKYEELSEEEFQEYVENLDTGEEKVQEMMDKLGIDGTETDEELREIAQEKAQLIVDAINGEPVDDPIVNDFMNELRGSRGGWNIGLRYAIYGVIKIINDWGIDINNILYSTGIATVCAAYFTAGCMHIAVHVGGAAIAAVGTSIILTAVQNIPNGMLLIQKGTTSCNPIDQAQGWADGISALYTPGMINSLAVGMMIGSPSPVPLVGSGMQIQIQHDSMKILIMISVLAAIMMMQITAVASMITRKQITFDSVLDALGCKDANDLLALFASIGIKLSLVTTIAQTIETTAGSTGTGLIIPFGP